MLQFSTDNVENSEITLRANEEIRERLKNLSRFTQLLKELKELNSSPDHIFFDIDLRDRLVELSEDFYSTWSASAKLMVENLGFNLISEIFKIFKHFSHYTWNTDEFSYVMDYIEDIDDIKVYRGQSKNNYDNGKIGFSWTLLEHMAEPYAHKYSDGIIIEGSVDLRNVYSLFSCEMEVVLNPEAVKIQSIRDIENIY